MGLLGSNDEDDATVTFGITTQSEIGFVDKLLLAHEFGPMIHLDQVEDAGPVEIWSMLNQSELRERKTKGLLDQQPINATALVAHRTDSYLRLRERETEQYKAQIYAHVMTSDNDTVIIQYWFFYLFDSVSPHQGDWEMIQVVFDSWSRWNLSSELIPARLAYSQHYGGEVREWDDLNVLKNGTHPWVFVTLGSHSSMFSGPDVPGEMYPLSIMSPSPWLNFAGKWGSSTWQLGPGGNSVPGPLLRSSMHRTWLGKPTSLIAFIWHEPLYWEARL